MARNSPLLQVEGANQLRGPRGMFWMARHWPALRREMQGAPGYIAHRGWYAPPFTVGLTSWWADEKTAYAFAQQPVHRRFWKWAHDGGQTVGGWLAFYHLQRGGPAWGSGVTCLMRRFGPHLEAADRDFPGPPPPVPSR